MRLGTLRRHWERLGRRDPFWAVLTADGTADGGWNVDQFYQSGEAEIARTLDHAAALGRPVPPRRALDFGCGAGRLTQALAARFAWTDGVDISASMLDIARTHDRHKGHCTYHLNAAADLALFDSGCFSFVYSTIVLQHMEPDYARRYITEFLRVLAPDGLLVFQIPSHRTAVEPSPQAARHAVNGQLPESACRASLRIASSALELQADREQALLVTIRNLGHEVWPSLPDARGRFRLNLANHWRHDDGSLFARDDARCSLPHDVAPGESVELMLGIRAPRFNGEYRLELDLVQENVGWFAERGSTPLQVHCTIHGGEPAPPRLPPAPEREPLPEVHFRNRHPGLFLVLKVTRLRDVYWAWRRGLDRARQQRDRGILWVKDHLYQPTVPPLINWWNSRPFAARMDMHCVPRADIVDLVAAHAGTVIEIEGERMPGGFQSYRYWVVKIVT